MLLVPPTPQVVPAAEPGGGTQPLGVGPEALSQSPSPSNPNRSEPGTDSGMCEIGADELFTTPISESSEFSYGPWLGPAATVVPLLETVIRNWQPESAPTGGHCVN